MLPMAVRMAARTVGSMGVLLLLMAWFGLAWFDCCVRVVWWGWWNSSKLSFLGDEESDGCVPWCARGHPPHATAHLQQEERGV